MRIDLNQRRGKKRKRTTRNIKILAATHYAIQINNCLAEIAKSVGVKEETVLDWASKPEWAEACKYWDPQAPPIIPCQTPLLAKLLRKEAREFAKTDRLWSYMIENGLDLFPSEIGKHTELTKFLRESDFSPIGIEAITWRSRLCDFLSTFPGRVKYKAWALYIWFILS